jgi:hypothetical protein
MSLESFTTKPSLEYSESLTATEPLTGVIPRPEKIEGLVNEDKKFTLEVLKKNISFEGFTLRQAEWVKDIMTAIKVPLGGVNRVALQATGDVPGAAQYIAESRSLIIYGGLLYQAALNDKERAKSLPNWKKKPDSGKYILAYALVHEIAGHARDSRLHVEVEKDPKTGELKATLPAEVNAEYGPDFIEKMELENEAVIQFCELSLETNMFLDDDQPAQYHRTVCKGWESAKGLHRLGMISDMAYFNALYTMIAETRAIMVETRFRGRRALKALDKAQVKEIASRRSITEAEVRESGYLPSLRLAEWFAARAVGQIRLEKWGTNRGDLDDHIRGFRRKLNRIEVSPFQFAGAGEE